MHVGAGFSVPFGFQTEYDKNWVGRYNAIKSRFESLDATLSASFDVTSTFSVGASVIAQKTSAELSSALQQVNEVREMIQDPKRQAIKTRSFQQFRNLVEQEP